MNASTSPAEEVGNVEIGLAVDDYAIMLREKILFGLSIYRELSPTMLQVFLGTSTPSKVWKPILDDLIAKGQIAKTNVPLESPHERSQNYTVLHLGTHIYIPPRVQTTPDSVQENDNLEGTSSLTA